MDNNAISQERKDEPKSDTDSPEPATNKLEGDNTVHTEDVESVGTGTYSATTCANTVCALNSVLGSATSAVTGTFVGMLQSYQEQLRIRPLLTKSVTAGIVGVLGEVIGATLKLPRHSRSHGGHVNKWHDALNLHRMAVFGGYGLFITGPFFHWWYGYLEKMVAGMNFSSSQLSFVAKLTLNQLVMTPPFLAFTLAYIQYFLSLDGNATIRAIKRTFTAALLTNWRVWTVAQAVNFTVVPLQYRVLFGNIVALWWNIYLSLVSKA